MVVGKRMLRLVTQPALLHGRSSPLPPHAPQPIPRGHHRSRPLGAQL